MLGRGRKKAFGEGGKEERRDAQEARSLPFRAKG